MNSFVLEPEVPGGWGEGTIADTSVHPPIVIELVYEFAGWLGDELIETFPCFVVSGSLASALVAAGLSGVELEAISVKLSPDFLSNESGVEEQKWVRLKPTGSVGRDDVSLSVGNELIVSERALTVFAAHKLGNCSVTRRKA